MMTRQLLNNSLTTDNKGTCTQLYLKNGIKQKKYLHSLILDWIRVNRANIDLKGVEITLRRVLVYWLLYNRENLYTIFTNNRYIITEVK